ncbi:SpoIIE family protein phosphatase [Terriglobus roseus]|uniref:Sigma-B regulation protein RsbU (Phosphoserine phosphatase) n=1 Tax=Terriglobus roseus TaxID=392734 RepID=A0A1G7J6X6_9BACT|nr:SpoIIE family protein phosphatase [Terriglobus roseus]SDF20747.1 sigma-B regulation protein RsbU (phosphoserine phosphatase) [Terriglobus roseus]
MAAQEDKGKREGKPLRVVTRSRASDASEVRLQAVDEAETLSNEFEGDYRPSPGAQADDTIRVDIPNHDMVIDPVSPNHPENRIRVHSEHVDFLQRLADALNNTLDLQTLMLRVAELVRAVVDYRIFAILLINDRTQELWMRFQVGHTPEVERMRLKMGQGIVGQAAATRASVLVDDVTHSPHYISANPAVKSELAIPLIIKNRVIGVIDLESEQPGAFTQDQRRLLELVASRMAVAVENARLYTRLSRQAQTLTVLAEISRELTAILDLDTLLERIGTLLKRVVDFQMFTILLWSESRQQFMHRFSTRFGERVQRDRNAEMGKGIFGIAAAQRHPILVPDVRKDPRYLGDSTPSGERGSGEVRSMIAVPLIYKEKVTGVIALEHTRVNYYNEDHQRTLTTLAGQIAIAITNARLYERIFEEEQRMERDLQMAREVQMRLLPPPPQPLPHAQFAATFLPARSIGGDVYDFIDYGNGRVAIAVGDVSGKAAPAALYAALVSGILRSVATQHLSPAAMLAELNNQLQERKLDSQYVTMLFAVWNDDERTLSLANAGSVQPMLVSSDGEQMSTRLIEAEGFPLGLFPNAEYEEFTISTRPGDLLVFFSDGIVDAENRSGEMFGNDRLIDVLNNLRESDADTAVKAVLESVSKFQDGHEHFDDETLLVLQVR